MLPTPARIMLNIQSELFMAGIPNEALLRLYFREFNIHLCIPFHNIHKNTADVMKNPQLFL